MATYCCPLCGAPMHTTFKASDHPAIPDRLLLHCTNRACDWCGTEDDADDARARRDGYARAWTGGVEAHAQLAVEAGR